MRPSRSEAANSLSRRAIVSSSSRSSARSATSNGSTRMMATARKPRPRRVRIVISEYDRRQDEVGRVGRPRVRNRRGRAIVAQVVDEQADAAEERHLTAEDAELCLPVLADCTMVQLLRLRVAVTAAAVIATLRGRKADVAELGVRVLRTRAVLERIQAEPAGDAQQAPFGDLDHGRSAPRLRRIALLRFDAAREEDQGDERDGKRFP